MIWSGGPEAGQAQKKSCPILQGWWIFPSGKQISAVTLIPNRQAWLKFFMVCSTVDWTKAKFNQNRYWEGKLKQGWPEDNLRFRLFLRFPWPALLGRFQRFHPGRHSNCYPHQTHLVSMGIPSTWPLTSYVQAVTKSINNEDTLLCYSL